MDTPEIILKGVTSTKVSKIHNAKGDIYHALKATEASFSDFGEAYFSTIHKGEVKGWKMHSRMVMNLVVPVGMVRFHFYNEQDGRHDYVDVGDDNYVRLTVESGVWMAFEGLGTDLNLLLNIASITHDPTEAVSVDIDRFPLQRAHN